MTNETNPGGVIGRPFPNGRPRETATRDVQASDMTLRDWFAGQALAGLLGNEIETHKPSFNQMTAFFAKSAYAYADAMIAERDK